MPCTSGCPKIKGIALPRISMTGIPLTLDAVPQYRRHLSECPVSFISHWCCISICDVFQAQLSQVLDHQLTISCDGCDNSLGDANHVTIALQLLRTHNEAERINPACGKSQLRYKPENVVLSSSIPLPKRQRRCHRFSVPRSSRQGPLESCLCPLLCETPEAA